MLLGLLLMNATLILSACVTMTGTDETKQVIHDAALAVACKSFVPISWSTKDTDQTIREVKAHNGVWDTLCKGGPDAGKPT